MTRPAPSAKPEARSDATTSAGHAETTSGGREWFDTVARLVAEVAEGLEYAHSRGVIHRDIKPANLLLSRQGRLCIGDFGLARIAQEPGMTVSGSFLGTPAYMSPEQIVAGRMKLDHRTDVYSLGAVLYEMLTLARPFPGESREEVVTRIMTKEPAPPRKLNHRIPVDLDTICLKALEKDPDRRYQTAGGMAEDLRRYLQRGLIMARRAGLARRAAKFVRRHPIAAVVVAAVVLVSATTGGVLRFAFSRQAAEAARRAVSDAQYDMSQGRYREALRRIDSALGVDRDLPEARLIRARILIKLNRANEAGKEAEELLKKDPDEWTAHLILAAAERSSEGRKFGTSIEEHIKAVEAHAPRTADAYYLRSLVADTATKAVEYLDRALELDPGHVDALEERAIRLSALYRFDAALVDCDRLVAARPRSAPARRLKADVYDKLGDRERALTEIARALELDPEDAGGYGARGWVNLDRSKYKDAIADSTKAIELAPEGDSAYRLRGMAYLNTSQYREAIADLSRALELNPESLGNYESLQWAHRLEGENDEARAVMERLGKEAARWTDPAARSAAHRTRALVFRMEGDYAQALAEAGDAIKLDPENWRGYVERAQARRLLDDQDGFNADCLLAAGMKLAEPAVRSIRTRAAGNRRWPSSGRPSNSSRTRPGPTAPEGQPSSCSGGPPRDSRTSTGS